MLAPEGVIRRFENLARLLSDAPAHLWTSGFGPHGGRVRFSNSSVILHATAVSSGCERGIKTRFATAAIVHEMIEAQDEKRLLRFQRQLAGVESLIIDELGFVPLSKSGAELLFELISQRYERGATVITSNLPFDEWTSTFGEERFTGALFDRIK